MLNKRFGERVPLFLTASAFKEMWRRVAGLLQVSWFFEKSFFLWEEKKKKNKPNKTAISFSCGGFLYVLQCWKQTQAC